MATKGPVPKRSDQRLGHTNYAGQFDDVERPDGSAPVQWPEADPDWHPIASDWYTSLPESGQAVYFEPSDVALARYVAQAMSENLSSGKFSAMLFTGVMTATSELLTSEASRRRLRIELQKTESPKGPSAAVANLSARRAQMEAKPTGTDS